MDCVAEPVIGRRFAPTRWLAMTVLRETAPVALRRPRGHDPDRRRKQHGVALGKRRQRFADRVRGGGAELGRLAFACWREPRENPFFMAPLAAAYKHVPKLPQQGPEDPGPFAFASEARVRRILDAAGFTGVQMEPCPLLIDAAIGRGLDGAVQGALEIGPVSRALEDQPADLRAAATASIRDALTPFAKGDAVLLPASVWVVTARAS